MFQYVDILASEIDSDRHYVGFTTHLNARLAAHNAGKIPHTRKHMAFRDKKKAAAFEKYLKSGSGRAFAKRHL